LYNILYQRKEKKDFGMPCCEGFLNCYRSPWLKLGVISFAIFVDILAYGVILPLLPIYKEILHIGDFGVGVLVATFSVGALPLQILILIFSGRLGRKISLFLGLILMALSTFCYIVAEDSFLIVVMARFTQGLGSGFTWTAGLGALADIFPISMLNVAMIYMHTAQAFGSFIGSPLGKTYISYFIFHISYFHFHFSCY
jgi:MFS family permease